MSESTPRVVVYARQSVSEDQGIAQQIADCRADAQRRGWPIVAEYADNDVSGSHTRGEKTAWQKMLRAFDAGEFETLMVTETTRLTRNLRDVLDVTPPTRAMRVVVIREGIDTSVDDSTLKLFVVLAEREVKLKSQRARRYAIERRSTGHPTPGKTPHGYRWVPGISRGSDGVRYVVDEDEASDVRRIFKEFLVGAPLAQIARDLTASGRRTRSGGTWLSSSVRRVLLNPAYAALLVPVQPTGKYSAASIDLEQCIPGRWEPLVDRDQLAAARGRLISVAPSHNGTARKWLLSGLAVCAVCREPVRSARGETHPTARTDGSGTAPTSRYHAYRCPNGHFMRNGDIIDEFVSRACVARLVQADARSLFPQKNEGVDVAALHARRVELESRQGTIAAFIAAGEMTPDAARKSLSDLKVKLREVAAQISEAVNRDPLVELIGISDVDSWWADTTLARRRSVVDALMTVVICRVGPGRRILTMEAAAASVGIEWRR